MRTVLVAVLCLISTRATAAEPSLPPVVFQTQPLGRILDDLRAGADIVGGQKGVKALNEAFQKLLGEKGFEGLDIGRPVVGYVVLAPKPEDITAFVAFPVTGEKEFLALCDRVNKDKLRVDEKDKSLYHLPPLDPRYKALMRFKDRYAYIAYGARPGPHIEPAALVPMEKLFDPAERGLVAARLHVGRIPAPVLLAARTYLDEARKAFAGKGLGKQEEEILKPVMAEMEKLVDRYVKYALDVESVAARLLLDAPSGNLIVEATLAGKANSELAKTIAAFKHTPHRFAALLANPDTVGGFTFRLPLFEPELRAAAVFGLEGAGKEAQKTPQAAEKPVREEFFKGLGRTVKTGEFDIAVAVRGPDKNGWFTAVGAVAFDDPSKLEKELRAFVEQSAPQEVRDAIKWDAAKAGTVSIHTGKMTPGGYLDPSKVFGGEDCSVAFAFAPKGLYMAMGPSAVDTLKEALAVKPAAAPILDVVLNPVRTTKLIQKIMGPEDPDIAHVEIVLGKEERLRSVLSARLEGGGELKAIISLDLRVLPRAILYSTIQRSGEEKKTDPPKLVK